MTEQGCRLCLCIAIRQRTVHSRGAHDIILYKHDVGLHIRELGGIKAEIPKLLHDSGCGPFVHGIFNLNLQRLHLSISLDFFFF